MIKKMGPMVRRYVAESALQWAHVNRLFVLGIMEEAGLMTPANAPSSTNSHPSEEPVKRTKVAKDPLHKQAEKLVPAAAINATSMFVPVLEKFPFLSETDVEHWDFIVTVAGVFMGASRLNNMRIGDAREEELMETVAVSLDNWNPDGIRGFEDCKGLYGTEYDRLAAVGHEPRFLASDAVGKWIVWNVLGRAPQTKDECLLVRATGAMVTSAFFDWWRA